jgi:hypothetical protein
MLSLLILWQCKQKKKKILIYFDYTEIYKTWLHQKHQREQKSHKLGENFSTYNCQKF